MKIAAVILVGGQSKRMGTDKTYVLYKGQTLLEHCQNILNDSIINDIYLSGKDGIKDQVKNLGPLGGISSCLEYLTDYDKVLFTPVDMPLLNKHLINHLIEQNSKECSYYQGFNLPLLINNSPSIRKLINQQINDKNLALYQLIKLLDSQVLECQNENCFINLNTPEQMNKLIGKL